MPGEPGPWRPDPKGGGFIRDPPPKEPEPPKDPSKDPLYGWKKDPEGTGYVRMDADEIPPIPRAGVWCQVVGLKQATDKNGLIVKVKGEPDSDGTVEIEFDGTDQFLIHPINLAPIRGSEKLAGFHKEHVLKVNGINCNTCKASLLKALCTVDGVAECNVTIATKEQTGKHPNLVTLKGAMDIDKVKEAIQVLDANRNKFTLA